MGVKEKLDKMKSKAVKPPENERFSYLDFPKMSKHFETIKHHNMVMPKTIHEMVEE